MNGAIEAILRSHYGATVHFFSGPFLPWPKIVIPPWGLRFEGSETIDSLVANMRIVFWYAQVTYNSGNAITITYAYTDAGMNLPEVQVFKDYAKQYVLGPDETYFDLDMLFKHAKVRHDIAAQAKRAILAWKSNRGVRHEGQ